MEKYSTARRKKLISLKIITRETCPTSRTNPFFLFFHSTPQTNMDPVTCFICHDYVRTPVQIDCFSCRCNDVRRVCHALPCPWPRQSRI